MAQLFDSGIFSVITETSAIGEGWTLGWFVAGTATPTNTYSEPSLDILTVNPNPVETDADGRFPPMWLGAGDYKYVLKDAGGVTIHTQDDYGVAGTPPSFDPDLDDFLAGDAPLPIANGGTGESTAPNAIDALGGLPVAGGTMEDNIIRQGKGVHLYWETAGLVEGNVFLTVDSDPDPRDPLPGQIWMKYS